MKESRLTIVWQGEIVGFVADPAIDMWHLYGKWVSAETTMANRFISAVRTAMDRWKDEMAGVEVTVGIDNNLRGEVTEFEGDASNVLLQPPIS